MKKTIYIILFVLIAFLAGCKDTEIFNDTITPGQRTMTIKATMPIDESMTRSITQDAESLDILLRWEVGNSDISIVFRQGDNLIRAKDAFIKTVDNEGKTGTFDVEIPQGIDVSHSFDLYGVCTSLLDEKNGKILSGVNETWTTLPDFAKDNLYKIPVWFEAKNLTAGATPNVNFLHLGSLAVITVKNSANTEMNTSLLECSLQPAQNNDPTFYYSGNYPFVDLLNMNADVTYADAVSPYQPTNLSIQPNQTATIVWWMRPNGNDVPETVLEMGDIRSVNTLPPRSPLKIGHAYHVYAVWDGDKLTIMDEMSPSSNPQELVFTVYECNDNWSPANPIEASLSEGAIIKIFDEDLKLYDELITDENGQASFLFDSNKQFYYLVVKGDNFANLYKGWKIAGLFSSQEEINNLPYLYPWRGVKPGDFKLLDANADGNLNDLDKIDYNYIYVDDSIETVYIGNVTIQQGAADILIDIQKSMSQFSSAYNSFIEIDRTLSTLSERQNSNPNTHSLIDFWNFSYESILQINYTLAKLASVNNSEYNIDKGHIHAYRARLYYYLSSIFGEIPLETTNTNIPALLGGLPSVSAYEIKTFIESEFTTAFQYLSNLEKLQLSHWFAAFLLQENFAETSQEAMYFLKEFIDSGLLIWNTGGDNDLYIKIYLLYADALVELGNIVDAIGAVNIIYMNKGQAVPLSMISTAEDVRETIKNTFKTNNDGLRYMNISRWGLNTNWDHFKLLPIPSKALNRNKKLTQNLGW